ncbi:Reverse transcriptase zinc-binding domain, partial [Arabidopsis thaliana x Arabidopsis arenosa]
MGITSHCSVSDALTTHRRRRHRVEILNKIEDELESLRLRTDVTGNDIPLWRKKNDAFKSKFYSKDTWHLIRQVKPKCSWYKGVWFPNSTPKHAFITWIAINNRLATGDRLIKWNASSNGSCVLCGQGVETRDHLFFSCHYSSQVWSALARDMLGSNFTARWESLLPLLNAPSTPRLHLFVLRYVFQLTIYSIWRERNGRRHGDTPTPASKLTRLIDKNARNRLSTLAQSGSPVYEGGLRYWFHTHS